MPFEVPDSWEWCKVGDIYAHNTGKALNRADNSGQLLDYITTSNLYWDTFVLDGLRQMYFTIDELEKCTVKKGDLLVCEGGDIGRAAIWPYDYEIRIQNHIHRLRGFLPINNRFYLYVLQLYKWSGLIGGKGIGLLGFSSGELDKLQVPLPPLNEQNRIVASVEKIFSVVTEIGEASDTLLKCITDTKNRIIELAISGKLVPQDPSDEPAIDLLKRINPSFKPCDNSHYENDIPDGWCLAHLEDVAKYGDTTNVDVDSIPPDNWILELEDIEKDTAAIIERKTKTAREINGVRHSFKSGQVLYSKLRTYLNKVLIAPEDGFCTTEIVPISAKSAILPDYLLIVLRSPYFLEYTASCGYGVKMPRLGTTDAKKAVIPIPPLAEQTRIVQKISDLMTVMSSL